MNTMEVVAKVSKLFGPDGGLLINLYDNFPEVLDMEEPVFAKIDSLSVPLFFDSFQRHGKSGAEVRFADFDTELRASELVGMELFMEFAEEEDDGLIYYQDLVGYTATFDDKPYKGSVSAFIDNDLNPLLEITVDGKNILVPAAEEMIAELDTESQHIEFSLPEGLLELYLDQ